MSELPPDPAAKGCFSGALIGGLVVPLVWFIALYAEPSGGPSPLVGLFGLAFIAVVAAAIGAVVGYVIGSFNDRR